jgi:single-stranded DNA-binding protein
MQTEDTNRIDIRGRLVKRPRVRFKNGVPILRLRIRSKRRLPGKRKRVRECEFDVEMYGPRARAHGRRLGRENLVDISGHLESREVPMEVDGKVVRDGEGNAMKFPKVTIVAASIDRVSASAARAKRSASRSGSTKPEPSRAAADRSPTDSEQPEAAAAEPSAKQPLALLPAAQDA